MIVTVTPNAVLDIWYEVERLTGGEVHFVRRMWARAGGKGVNVTSVLTSMGHASLAAGFAGGPAGQTILADLTDRGVPHLFTDVRESSRRIVTVFPDEGALTRFAEPGPTVSTLEWEQLQGSVEPLILGPATALVVSGRMPVGSASDTCVSIMSLARAHGVATIVDAGGVALIAAADASADVVKPTLAELRAATGRQGPVEGARELQRIGAGAVIVILGAQGVLVVPEDGPMLRAWLPRQEAGDALGAGDALAAAVSIGLNRDPWEELVRRGVAWAGAAARAVRPGDIDPADVAALGPLVEVEEFTGHELDLR